MEGTTTVPYASQATDQDIRYAGFIEKRLQDFDPFNAETFLRDIHSPSLRAECQAKITAAYDRLSAQLVAMFLADNNVFDANFYTKKIQGEGLRSQCAETVARAWSQSWDQFNIDLMQKHLANNELHKALQSAWAIEDETVRQPYVEKIESAFQTHYRTQIDQALQSGTSHPAHLEWHLETARSNAKRLTSLEEQTHSFQKIQNAADNYYSKQVEECLKTPSKIHLNDPTHNNAYCAIGYAKKIAAQELRASCLQQATNAYHACCKTAIEQCLENNEPAHAMLWADQIKLLEFKDACLKQILPAYAEYCQREIAFRIEISRGSALKFAEEISILELRETCKAQIASFYDPEYTEKIDNLLAVDVFDANQQKRAQAYAEEILSDHTKQAYLQKIALHLPRL